MFNRDNTFVALGLALAGAAVLRAVLPAGIFVQRHDTVTTSASTPASSPPAAIPGAGNASQQKSAEPVQPKATATGRALNPAAPAASPAPVATTVDGESVAKTTCFACHQSGVMNAPKVGDRAAWEPRLQQGFDTLLAHALQGFKVMPARGGNASLSDEQVKAALSFMLTAAGLAAPAGQPGTAAAAPSAGTPEPSAAKTSGGSADTLAPAPTSAAPNPQTQAAAPTAAPDTLTGGAATSQAAEATADGSSAGATSPSAVATRVESAPAAPPPVQEHPGRRHYDAACASCHDKGTDGAPLTGDKSVWTPLFGNGLAPLVRRIADGFPGHPSARRQGKLTDAETEQAVDYIMAQTFWPSNR